MPRKLRFIPEECLVEVTCRTIQGRFLLRPSGPSGVIWSEAVGASPGVHAPRSTEPTVAEAAPSLGSASLGVDQQIHLGKASQIFKDGEIFLWDEVFSLGPGAESGNTALGRRALASNTLSAPGQGASNTALGFEALKANSSGNSNTAVGVASLRENLSGESNVAVGQAAVASNTTGGNNTAIGVLALRLSPMGSWNTAVGMHTLVDSYGDRNIAIGYEAGLAMAGDESDNIFIGSPGSIGDNHVIRIGGGRGEQNHQQNRTFISGIVDRDIFATHPVYINANGRLGRLASSRRYKQEIRDVGKLSERLLELRPVTFRYRPESEEEPQEEPGPIQFGLVAEEVAEVFPELASYDDEEKPSSVRYHLLSSLLLNEVQSQHRRLQMLSWLVGLMLLTGIALTVGRRRFG